jgi:hypothetical protein
MHGKKGEAEKFLKDSIKDEKLRSFFKLDLPTVEVLSSGWESGPHSSIVVNGQKVDCYPNTNMATRGIHLVVIDTLTHDIELAQVYDTHGLEMDSNNFYSTLSVI